MPRIINNNILYYCPSLFVFEKVVMSCITAVSNKRKSNYDPLPYHRIRTRNILSGNNDQKLNWCSHVLIMATWSHQRLGILWWVTPHSPMTVYYLQGSNHEYDGILSACLPEYNSTNTQEAQHSFSPFDKHLSHNHLLTPPLTQVSSSLYHLQDALQLLTKISETASTKPTTSTN